MFEEEIQKYYGLYNGVIQELLPDGDAIVVVNSVAGEPLKAKLVQMSGGNNALAGIRVYPEAGSNCIIGFEQGEKTAPKVLGYVDSTGSKIIGDLRPGEIMIRTSTGSQFSVNNDSVDLVAGSNGYGFGASKQQIKLKHKGFELSSTNDRTYFETKGAVTTYTTSGMLLQTKNFIQTDDSHKNITAGERYDFSTGNFILQSDNNFAAKGSQINLQATEEINFSARNDIASMSNTFSVTTSTDIFMGSVLGSVDIAANAGSVELGAGTVATAQTGITVAKSKFSLSPLGTIEANNIFSWTTWTPEGSISETALVGFGGIYGPSGFSVKAAGDFAVKSLSASITTLKDIQFTSAFKMDIKVGGELNVLVGGSAKITTGATMDFTTAGRMGITCSFLQLNTPLVKWTPGVPIMGVKCITLLGPQFIIPFA